MSTSSGNRITKGIRFHKDDGLLDWIELHGTETGRSVNQVVLDVLFAYHDDTSETDDDRATCPICTARDRQRTGATA